MTRKRTRVGPQSNREAPALDVDALLDDPAVGIIVCCGSGGVGKTTTSAALALRAAERGRHVVVLTIDPARRLAQSMGIEQLDNTPRPVVGVDASAGGHLDAMMLDMKRTFDEVVESQATPEKARQILDNPFYQRAVQLLRRDAGVHGDGEARPDPPRRPHGGELRPDRGRHAAVTLGAGLPRRPRAALELPRRPVHPAAAGSGARSGADDDGRVRHGHQRADQGPRRARCCATCRPSWPRSTRCSAASASGASRPSACCRTTARRSSWSPHPSRTRCARRRTSSNGSARTRCRSRGWSSTAPRRRRTGTLTAEEACRRGRASARGPASVGLAGRGTAAAARRPAPAGRTRGDAAAPVRRRAPRGADGGGAGAGR